MIHLVNTDDVESRPQALNEAGTIVGYFYETYVDAASPATITHSTGFIWQDDGTPHTLMSPLPGAPVDGRIEPYGISNDGKICGGGKDAADTWQPFVWESGTYTLLDTLTGGEGIARDLTDNGLVVGESLDGAGVWKPVLWQADGTIIDLGLLDSIPMQSGAAHSVNSSGTVIGWDDPVNFIDYRRAWVWKDEVKSDLSSILNPHAQHQIIEAHDINENGTIVGGAITHTDPFFYGKELSTPLGPFSVALIPQNCSAPNE